MQLELLHIQTAWLPLIPRERRYSGHGGIHTSCPVRTHAAPQTITTARFVSVLVANPSKITVNSVAELIDQAKKEPGKIDIAHAGTGNPFHLAAVLFG